MILLTDREMAECKGGDCLTTIDEFLTCDGCSANCKAIAQTQLRKVIEWGEECCQHKDAWTVRHECPQCWQSLKAEVEGK